MKYSGTRYGPAMDASAWTLLLLVVAVCAVPVVIEPSWWMILLMGAMEAFAVLTFAGIYYRIDGAKLVVYQFFIPKVYPIGKIAEVKPTKSLLSAPATSLTQRLAIKFTDRSVMKSYLPLIISPSRRQEFTAQLRAINPNIHVGSQL